MTTLRPYMIRADTIDLQDPLSPSAQDHSLAPARSAPLRAGNPAPHQATAIRRLSQERIEEEGRLDRGINGQTHYQHDDTIHNEDIAPGLHQDDLDDQGDEDAGDDDTLDDDMMDKISSSPSIDDEDIDFEFVYALHTFVATVEGQANATKGDTMVLLDDSNSYWWLVRIVKDNSIGYLPAEHIETPTERLARLNKHRNIDLSASMLGDTTEKTKNPLKKAMRRRNAKTVAFTQPTYVEPSDYEYSSDEEDSDELARPNGEATNAEGNRLTGSTLNEQGEDESSRVAPLNIEKDNARRAQGGVEPEKAGKAEDPRKGVEEPRTSEDSAVRQYTGKSRNGTLRNTDSFLKDDNAETRKITLTPNLLRDDTSSNRSSNSNDMQGPEGIERGESPSKGKENKKKEKKGMLSGLFKRKDKKKSLDDLSDREAADEIMGRSPRESPKESPINSPTEKPESPSLLLQRNGSKGKLQKAPPSSLSNGVLSPRSASPPKPTGLNTSTINSVANEDTPIDPSPMSPVAEKPAALRVRPPGSANVEPDRGQAYYSTRSPEEANSKPQPVRKASQRVALDVDSSPELDAGSSNPFADPSANEDEEKTSSSWEVTDAPESPSESPVEISPITKESVDQNGNVRAIRARDASPTSSRSSPSFMEVTSDTPTATVAAPQIQKPITTSNSAPSVPPSSAPPPPPTRAAPSPFSSGPTSPNGSQTSPTVQPLAPRWSDASLKHYLDNLAGNEIMDMLLLIKDTTGVKPVGKDHPIMQNLYREEREKVCRMNKELDSLLDGWLEKKKKGKAEKAAGRGFVAGKV